MTGFLSINVSSQTIGVTFGKISAVLMSQAISVLFHVGKVSSEIVLQN